MADGHDGQQQQRVPLALALCLRGMDDDVDWADMTSREHGMQHQRLWSLFQVLADSVSNLYKECHSEESPTWPTFQSAASALTQFYKESLEMKKRSHELGRRLGYQQASLELGGWLKSLQQHGGGGGGGGGSCGVAGSSGLGLGAGASGTSPPHATGQPPTAAKLHSAHSPNLLSSLNTTTTAAAAASDTTIYRTADKMSAFHISSACSDSSDDEGLHKPMPPPPPPPPPVRSSPPPMSPANHSGSQPQARKRTRTPPSMDSTTFLFDLATKRTRYN